MYRKGGFSIHIKKICIENPVIYFRFFIYSESKRLLEEAKDMVEKEMENINQIKR
jgi:hypothetical protein